MRLRPLPYNAEAARRHLMRRDAVMRDIIKAVGPFEMQLRGKPYQSLVRAIIYQQLAGAAASAIERRSGQPVDNRPKIPINAERTMVVIVFIASPRVKKIGKRTTT